MANSTTSKPTPNETHNQWNNPDYTTVRLDLMTRLADRMAWTVDPMPAERSRILESDQ